MDTSMTVDDAKEAHQPHHEVESGDIKMMGMKMGIQTTSNTT